MTLFHAKNQHLTEEHCRTYAAFEIAYTIVDFAAAMCFVAGSLMFFSDAWETPALWMFLIGSILFACKPTLRLVRELRLMAIGRTKDVADKFSG